MQAQRQTTGFRFFARHMALWLEKRLPAQREKTLGYRSIFIFPTPAGFFFLFLLLIILLAAINYQNNMLYAFVFLLGSVFAVSIVHCYRNLSGLRISYLGSQNAFAGCEAVFRFVLRQVAGRTSEAIRLHWPEQGQEVLLDCVDSRPCEVPVEHKALRRGLLRPGRLLIESVFPLGLIRAWTWLDLKAVALVYPGRLPAPARVQPTEENVAGTLTPLQNGEDYQGLREYAPGDSLRQIAWKQYAQKGDFYTKSFETRQGESQWLDLRDFPGADLETKLSFLCDRVLESGRHQQRFGLKLGGQTIKPALGEGHQEQCLRALALYGVKDEAVDGLLSPAGRH